MTQLFGVPIDTLATILLAITSLIIGAVVLLAVSNAIFFKIAVRNIPRRRTQMVLIVFALMLSTTLLSSVLATGDVMTTAVQSVAVYNWGNVDEVIEGGHGETNTYSDGVYYTILDHAQHNSDIAGVAAALREQDLLVADETSRQVRSKVTGLAVLPGSERNFGGMHQDGNTKKLLSIAALQKNQVYLNHTTALLLNAHAGDTLYLYSERWSGQRYTMQVAAIVEDGGLVGDNPYMLTQLSTFQRIEGDYDAINQIFISNRGGGGISGVSLSDRVTDTLSHWISGDVHIIQVKQEGIENAQSAEDIFSRIFALFCLFALAIGLLLILLIYVLLAAERRAEMGMARAIGVQRRHLVLMFLFEGTVYDLMASFVGLAVGVGVGALLVVYLQPILLRFNFPLKLTFQPRSLILSYCLGVIFTFCSVAVSSWLVSRMTVVEAMRDLPEQRHAGMSLGELGARLVQLVGQLGGAVTRRKWRPVRRILLEHVPDTLLSVLRVLITMGFLPLLAGYQILQLGLENTQIIPFSLGLSLIVIGGGLLVKTILTRLALLLSLPAHWIARLLTTLIALTLVAYWALPFDVLAYLGLPRFEGGIEVFFVAGVMMILGAAWAVLINADILLKPLLTLCSWLPRVYALAKLASAYPLHRRFRTGLSVAMFSMVVFAMTVMAIITNSMQNNYVDINTQTGGYDIQATAYFKSLPDLRSSLAKHGINPAAFSAIGVRSSTAVGVIQPSAQMPRWYIYPAQVVSGGFLQGYGLHLSARARGFNNDRAVWQALQTHSNYALIDSSTLPYNPNIISSSPVYDPSSPQGSAAGVPSTPPGFDSRFAFTMSGVYQGDTTFAAAPVWVVGSQGDKAIKLTIIGVVDNSDSAHYGLYIAQPSYSSSSISVLANDPSTPNAQSYYFKVAAGQDKRALALALGSAYLDNGLETTVLEDAIWQIRGPRILLSNVLLGVVGLTLLLGVAALAITGTRAVIERRQQIGMLRALGCKRHLVQFAFLLESFLVGVLGSSLGVALGIVLAHNIFSVNFFERFNLGLTFSIPWNQLGLIVGVALLSAFLGALLPAWQAGRVAPAEALRYQ